MEPNDARPVIHPASFSGMREKIITVGAASKENASISRFHYELA